MIIGLTGVMFVVLKVTVPDKNNIFYYTFLCIELQNKILNIICSCFFLSGKYL